MNIPKNLHVIWVGDHHQCPHTCIDTWKANHTSWNLKIWTNDDLDTIPWRCKSQIEKFRAVGAWEGVADIMRYEILNTHGGFYFDADSYSIRPLDESLLENKMFAVWESEHHRPGLIANGFIGSRTEHPVLEEIIKRISAMPDPVFRYMPLQMKRKRIAPYKTVGPCLFTHIAQKHPADITVFPSILFLPRHYLDPAERTGGPVYARHIWHTTRHAHSV